VRNAHNYRERVGDLLRAQPEGDWMPAGTIAELVTDGGAWTERNAVSQVLCKMVRDRELVRTGKPPRGYVYRANPEYVPPERERHCGPASAYEGPAIGDGRLCPVIGAPVEDWQLPEAA
jgi:hypothetical protein